MSSTNQTFRRHAPRLGAVSLVALLAAAVPLSTPAQTLEAPALTPAAFNTIVDEAAASVVSVSVIRRGPAGHGTGRAPADDLLAPFLDRFGGQVMPRTPFAQPTPASPERLAGGGFAVEGDGLIATADALVAGADRIEVTTHDGRVLDAEIAGRDPSSGLALLRVNGATDLPPLNWSTHAPSPGQAVATVGRTDDLGPVLSAGIVAAHDGVSRVLIDDAASPALLGAPVLDQTGRVVAVRTGGDEALAGTVLAVAADGAQDVIADLATAGTVARGYLGVQIQPVTADIADALTLDRVQGAVVAEVRPDTPAAAAGLVAGDVILAMDGKPITTPQTLSAAVASRDPGTDVTLDVWRSGERIELSTTLAALPGGTEVAAGAPANDVALPDLGVSLTSLTAELRDSMGLAETVNGVVVSSVDDPSLDDLQPGDVIVSVQRIAVETVEDVRRAVEEARDDGRSTLLLLVDRKGVRTFVTIPLAAS